MEEEGREQICALSSPPEYKNPLYSDSDTQTRALQALQALQVLEDRVWKGIGTLPAGIPLARCPLRTTSILPVLHIRSGRVVLWEYVTFFTTSAVFSDPKVSNLAVKYF